MDTLTTTSAPRVDADPFERLQTARALYEGGMTYRNLAIAMTVLYDDTRCVSTWRSKLRAIGVQPRWDDARTRNLYAHASRR